MTLRNSWYWGALELAMWYRSGVSVLALDEPEHSTLGSCAGDQDELLVIGRMEISVTSAAGGSMSDMNNHGRHVFRLQEDFG